MLPKFLNLRIRIAAVNFVAKKCIENVLNLRPLTCLNLYESLAPFHMIYGKSFNSRCEINVNDKVKGDNLYVQAKHTEMVSQLFYHRFNKGYILALLERHSLGTKKNSSNQAKLPIGIGEIVIIKDDKPRLLWRKGKINKFLENRDGKIRGAELVVFQPKTKKTCIINRSMQHLILLEVSEYFEEEKGKPEG